ncbi:uncharacterized protein [Anolis sagrei]|uniref:uncharacterized protein n=1 Tax=Anolis sagrei TaxID=38937 RepID=UPI00352088C4
MVQTHHYLPKMTYYRSLGYCDPCSYSNASNGYQRLYIQMLPSEYYACTPCWNIQGHQISCVFPWHKMRFNYCSPCYSYNCCRPSYHCYPLCHNLRSNDYIPEYKSTSPCYGPKTRHYSPYYSFKTKGRTHSSSNNQRTHLYGSTSCSYSPCYRTETIRGTPYYSSNECSPCYSSPSSSSCYNSTTTTWSPCYSSYDSPSSSCSSCYTIKTPCYNNHQRSPCHRCSTPYYTSGSRCSPGYTFRRCSPCCSSKCYSPHYNSPHYRYSQCLSCYRSRRHSPYYLFGSRCGAPGCRNSHHPTCERASYGCHSPSHSSTCSSSHSTSCTYSLKSSSYSSGCRRCSCPW